MDSIIFDGHLSKAQQIVVGGMNGPIVTKVRALLTPKPLDEIRDPSNKFDSNDIVYAAAGVKILAPDVDDVIAGLPIRAVGPDDDIEEIKEQIEEELQAINITTDDDGIILKADALGSLEAATGLFQQEGLKIRKAGVGVDFQE